MNPPLPELREVIVELSHNCNLRCTMCGFGNEVNPHDSAKFMPFTKYRSILDQLKSVAGTIRLNGRGESTIHPDFLPILEYTRNRLPDVGINLFSNLSFRRDRLLEALVDQGVQLFVSLDSPVPEELVAIRTGVNVEAALGNLEQLRHHVVRPFIVITLQERNLHRIADMARFARSFDCHILYNAVRRDRGMETFVRALEEGHADIVTQFEDASRMYSDGDLLCLVPDQIAGVELSTSDATRTHGSMYHCPALDDELCVLHDGTVTPCNMFHPYVYGNLAESSLDQIWNGTARKRFMQGHRQTRYCASCANLGM